MELGANEYLVKPTGFSELKEIIARLVEKYKLAI
jgi:YesN/AraC family two-component response regulator